VWPAALLVFALTHSPPELPVEKLARLEQLERDAGIGQ
jgi:hypothetical protein